MIFCLVEVVRGFFFLRLLIALIPFHIFAETSDLASKALGILHPAFKIRRAWKCNAAPLSLQQTSSCVVIFPKNYFYFLIQGTF